MNTLYHGDNLDILREYIPDESAGLIYLDPPFNSNRSYNVLFKEANATARCSSTSWCGPANRRRCGSPRPLAASR